MTGYMGKILRVDLTPGKITEEGLPPEDILRKYLSGYGLGLWMLYHECPPGISALDPENPMIFMNGVLVGTQAPSSNNLTLVTKNADTDFTAGRSHTHGWFGVNLKFAGYDALIIQGQSPRWVYLHISDGKAELRDASPILGKDTWEMEDAIPQDRQAVKYPSSESEIHCFLLKELGHLL